MELSDLKVANHSKLLAEVKAANSNIEKLLTIVFNNPSYFVKKILAGVNKEKAKELFLKGEYDVLEDLYYEYLEGIFPSWDQEKELDVYKKFSFDTFFPGEKNVGFGAWIKVPTERGFSIHYAKVSRKKIDWSKELIRIQYLLQFKKLKSIKEDELEDIRNYITIGFDPYIITYKVSKNKSIELKTYEYELYHGDIDTIVDAVASESIGIKVKCFYTTKTENQVFYLRSRGISKIRAELMANLQNCYFDIDLLTLRGVE